MADEKENNEADDSNKKSGLSTIKVVILVVLLTVFVGGGLVGGTVYFMGDMNVDNEKTVDKKNKDDSEAEDLAENEDEENEDEEEEPLADPNYFSMDPKFVVSFSDQSKARFMQFSIDVMSRDKMHFKNIEMHRSAIRSSLLMLFGSQNADYMSTREGKEKLLSDAVIDINKSLVKMTGNKTLAKSIESAYFNSFVIQ